MSNKKKSDMKVEVWRLGSGYGVRINDNIHQELFLRSEHEAHALLAQLQAVLCEKPKQEPEARD